MKRSRNSVHSKAGVGTFISGTLSDDSLSEHEPLRQELQRWLDKARAAGLGEESIEALFLSTFRARTGTDMHTEEEK
ncbi:hypothetical protein [Streptomyces sp. 147326]|uniref:hypothetical protein n=1 Tax=Streptomyces sp. 147326 TaxID=3074379 RepID=UPI00385757E6